MARLTKGSFLMYKTTAGGTYSKLCDITEYPDLDQEPETEDSTTLSDTAHTYIMALPDSGGSYVFNTWLSATDGALISGLKDQTVYLAFYVGGTESGGVITPTGSVFKREWQGQVSYQITGAGTADIAPASVACTVGTVPSDTWGSDS